MRKFFLVWPCNIYYFAYLPRDTSVNATFNSLVLLNATARRRKSFEGGKKRQKEKQQCECALIRSTCSY